MNTRVPGGKTQCRNDNKTFGEKRTHSEKRLNVHFPDWKTACHDNKTTQLVVSYKEGKKISKLREPRNLFELQHRCSKIHIPRWPVEMKVLSDHPRHMEYHPCHPEKFHNQDSVKKSNFEFPMLSEVENGTLVYENTIIKTEYFARSRPGGTTIKTRPSYPLLTDDSNTLHFESRFESGNLFKAIKIGPYDYQLWLRTDLYTEKYTQWYYFSVENMLTGVDYRFTIMNLVKSSSLYSQGMRPLMYSEQSAKEKKIGWQRDGENITYYKNEIKPEDGKCSLKGFYSLSWTIKFAHSGDRCYFAHCYPYTYTDLQEYLRNLSRDPRRSYFCKQKILTRSLAGNFVYIITITNPSKCLADAKNKRAVVFTARVHPGETNSSWMMKGLLDYLTSEKEDAKLLRDTFVFKIVPMLNPDGVVVGNYRCSLTGRDLNRNYKTEFKEAFPSVWYTREMIKSVNDERQVILYCDLHGHSRQHNVFIYGCEDRKNIANGFNERVFPMMMAKNCRDKFCFNRCKFKVQKSKSGTGRVVMWNLGIQNSYTLEATFCGSTLGSKAGQHFTILDYESMGYHLCDTLLDYCDPDMSKYLLILQELDIYVKELILRRLKETGQAGPDMDSSDIDLDRDYVSESSTEGSDSSVSDGPPMQVLYSKKFQRNSLKKKKKRLKTRKERNKQRTKTVVSPIKKNSEPGAMEDISNTVKNPPTTSNDLPSEQQQQQKNSRSSPRNTVRIHPPKYEAPKKMTVPHRLNDVKVYHHWNAINKVGNLLNTQSDLHNLPTPRLRLTNHLCVGLAPANFSTSDSSRPSLSRWSGHRQPATTGRVKEQQDEEGSFIERYLAKQITLNEIPRDGDSKITLDGSSPSKDDNTTDKIKTSAGTYCLYHSSIVREYDTNQRDHDGRITENKNSRFITDHEELNANHEKLSTNHGRLNTNHGGLNTNHERLKTNHERLSRNHERLNTNYETLSANHERLSTNYERLSTNHGGLGTNHHKNHGRINTHDEAVNTDFGTLRQSQSMKLLDEKGQNDKELSSVERRVSESSLPLLCENGVVLQDEKKYVNVRRVPNSSINNSDGKHRKHDSSGNGNNFMENDGSLLPKNYDNQKERLVPTAKPQNVFPDLRANSKLVKEENRIPRKS